MITQELTHSVEQLNYSKLIQEQRAPSENRQESRALPRTVKHNQSYIPLKRTRIALKASISVPYLIAWFFWISKPTDVPTTFVQIPVFMTLVGYTTVFAWLAVASISNVAISLKVWKYYTVFFVPLSLAALVCSLISGSAVIGFLLATGGVLCVIDIVLSLFIFPPIIIVPPPPRPPKTPTTTAQTELFMPEGPLFVYIPLGGGPSISLSRYSEVNLLDISGPSMKSVTTLGEESHSQDTQTFDSSMPSTSQQLPQADNEANPMDEAQENNES